MNTLQLAGPGIAGFILFLLLHVLLWQLLPQKAKGLAALTILAAISFMAFLASAVKFIPRGFFEILLTSGPVYAFLCVCYYHFYFGVVRSLSVRILGELAATKKGTMTPNQLENVYPKRDMVAQRLEVMVRKGYLVTVDDRYICTEKGRKLVRLALLGKRIYNLDATG